jgi:FkbM family methyltransferase
MIYKILNKVRNIIFPRPIIIKDYKTYSQAGEDAILSFLFSDKKLSNISYLDLGTNLPDICNNTYLLYKNGNRGVCVEADKTLIPIIEKARPQDKILNAGVSVSTQLEADFYIFNIKGLNTFDKNEAEHRASSGRFKIMEVVKVSLININQIINDNFKTYPDLLSIDIEGLDLEVLKSLDFNQYPIPVICVETCTFSENHIRPKDPSISEFIISKGYEIYADTYINTILVNKNWFYKY